MTLYELQRLETFLKNQSLLYGQNLLMKKSAFSMCGERLLQTEEGAVSQRKRPVPSGSVSNRTYSAEVLDSILVNCSDRTLFELSTLLDPSLPETRLLNERIQQIRTQNMKEKLQAVESNELTAYLSKWISEVTVDETFFDVLTRYIEQAGYKKFSDFYKKDLELNRKKWYLYSAGKQKPDKSTVFWMIFFLGLDLLEATYLLNAAGYVFEKNNKTDMAVLFYLKEEITKSMTPEEALISLDETLEYLGEPPIYTIQ